MINIKTKNLIGVSIVIIATLIWLYVIQGYATGYGFSRVSLVSEIKKDYGRDGGEWSFGWVVLPAILTLIFLTRKRYQELELKPDHIIGGLLLLIGFFVYFAGFKANQKYFGYASGQIIAVGAIFWFLGRQWFFMSFWLVVLLGMMWPWRFLIEPISFPLQLIMVKLTTGFLNLIGDPAISNGTAIMSTKVDPVDGGAINLNVAAACSGLRSLFALFMMGLIYGYLSLKKEWKRVLLISLVPLIAIIGNFVRMMMLYFGTQVMGRKVAIGEGEHDPSSYHITSGLAVFVVAIIVMMICVELMNRGFRMLKKRKTVVKNVA